jgi:hypothetical protein
MVVCFPVGDPVELQAHGLEMDTDSPPTEAFAKRVAYLKRVLARGVGCTPTAAQKLAIQRAALLTAKAEAAALDPNTSPNDVVRLDGAAHRARQAMLQTFAARKPKQLGPESLRQYASSKYRVPA